MKAYSVILLKDFDSLFHMTITFGNNFSWALIIVSNSCDDCLSIKKII
jgi:hypothetical protein